MKNLKMVMLPVEKAYLYLQNSKLYDNRTTMHMYDGSQIPQHLYVVDTEATIESDDTYLENGKTYTAYSNFVRLNGDDNIYKVIASTDKSLDLKEIPSKLISLFIEKHKKGMELSQKDFSVYVWDEIQLEELIDNEDPLAEPMQSLGWGKPQVDFDLLEESIKGIINNTNTNEICRLGHRVFNNPEIENLALFFEMMKKSSSFAHKAHLELK